MVENALVSIIIPTYNREKTIKRSVESVLQQTWDNIEVIVVDDGSTDKTKSIISQIQDKRLKYYKIKNSGACAARNYGIKRANGQYIAFQDSDDYWYENKIEKQIWAINEYDVDIVACRMKVCVDGKCVDSYPIGVTAGIKNSPNDIFGINTPSIIGKREIFDEILFDKSMPRFQDFELLVRVIDKYKLLCIDDELFDYNQGEDSISSNPEKLLKAIVLIDRKYPNLLENNPNVMNFFTYSIEQNLNKINKWKLVYKEILYWKYKREPRKKTYFRYLLSWLCI